jgi:hypothetical protein
MMVFSLALACGLGLMAMQFRLLMRYLSKGPDRSDQMAALGMSIACATPILLTVSGLLQEPYVFLSFVILGTAALTGIVTGLASQMTIAERKRSGRYGEERGRRRS